MARKYPTYEPILSPAPDSYVHYQTWPEYATESHFGPMFQPLLLPGNPRGFRRGLWPFFVEEYISDEEPNLQHDDPEAPARFILWRRISRTDRPLGWIQSDSRPSHIESFIELTPGEEYATKWAKIARNERRRWLELAKTTYDIVPLSGDELIAVYKKSSVQKRIGVWPASMFVQKQTADPEHYFIFGVRTKLTGKVIAAMAFIDSPTHQSSYYDVGCKVDPLDDPVMVGLIDHWFMHCIAHNIRYLQMGGSWIPGKPKSWKGFSTFKSKFKPGYIVMPPLLWKFKKGKLFKFS